MAATPVVALVTGPSLDVAELPSPPPPQAVRTAVIKALSASLEIPRFRVVFNLWTPLLWCAECLSV